MYEFNICKFLEHKQISPEILRDTERILTEISYVETVEAERRLRTDYVRQGSDPTTEIWRELVRVSDRRERLAKQLVVTPHVDSPATQPKMLMWMIRAAGAALDILARLWG